jgi:hypothetical protein
MNLKIFIAASKGSPFAPYYIMFMLPDTMVLLLPCVHLDGNGETKTMGRGGSQVHANLVLGLRLDCSKT